MARPTSVSAAIRWYQLNHQIIFGSRSRGKAVAMVETNNEPGWDLFVTAVINSAGASGKTVRPHGCQEFPDGPMNDRVSSFEFWGCWTESRGHSANKPRPTSRGITVPFPPLYDKLLNLRALLVVRRVISRRTVPK